MASAADAAPASAGPASSRLLENVLVVATLAVCTWQCETARPELHAIMPLLFALVALLAVEELVGAAPAQQFRCAPRGRA
jgi:hypothetical protein